jgi:hypothetical protein
VKKLTKAKLQAIKDRQLPTADWTTFQPFAAKYTAKAAKEQTPEHVQAINDYLARYIPPQKECIGCGDEVSWRFTWGLTHGEGFCNLCGWPMRAYHFDVGPFARIEVILQYHPSGIEIRRHDGERNETD